MWKNDACAGDHPLIALALDLFACRGDHRYSAGVPLPETIAIRFTEEDAGYVTVRPVVKQTFRFAELTDMVVSVTGKNVSRVQQIFRAGTVLYNGYRYWWEGFALKEEEIGGILATFPEDDPSRPFDREAVTAVAFEIGGGAQRSLVTVTRKEASSKRLFQKRSPWEILLKAAQNAAPRYEKYAYAERADVYRLHLSPEAAASMMKEVFSVSPRILRRKLAALRSPAALLFFAQRAHSLGT